MFERLDLADKINKERRGKGKTYIGYDLGAGYGEISLFQEHDLNPTTLLSRGDATVFHFPCMLVKYKGRFYAGFDALNLSREEDAIVFEDLLEIAMNQPSIVVAGQRFETEYLLGLFLKLTLSLPEQYGKVEKAGAIMFTTYIDEDPILQERVYEVLTRATAQIFHRRTKLYLQTRSESIYYFLMNQEEALYREEALFCDYQRDYLKAYFLRKHGAFSPFTITVDRMDYPDMAVTAPYAGEELTISGREEHLDEIFRQVLLDIEAKFDFGLSYLIGDGFKGNWMNQSLITLCHHGRAFQGNNLYSMGACYCLRNMIAPTEVHKQYVFLSNLDIAWDIGMYVTKQGFLREGSRPEYYQIFKRGSYYKHCKKTFYLLPEGEEALVIEAKSLGNNDPKKISIDLTELGVGKAGEAKLEVTIEFINHETLSVSVCDIGLGELLPGSGQILQETFNLG